MQDNAALGPVCSRVSPGGNRPRVSASAPGPTSAVCRVTAGRAARNAAFILTAFILLQLACQIGLLIPALAKARILFRSAALVASLAAFVLVAGRGRRHPAALFGLLSLAVLGVEIFHPSMNSWLAALAQIAENVAILGPLFWVSRLAVTPAVLKRVVFLFWTFHSLSAVVGVLQVYYPGRFQPAVSEVVTQGTFGLDKFTIVLADGRQTLRPMGLTDTPGGAAGSGLYAALFGIGFFLNSRSLLARGVAVASILAGLFCIYLSQTRSLLVMVAISTAVLAFLQFRRGDGVRAIGLALLLPAAAVASFLWAAKVGGDATVRRMQTLSAETAGQVYYENRGHFLEETIFQYLPEYPLGAGLGRWGMMYTYFGNKAAPSDRGLLWAEIQMTGWLFDGGVPLMLTYSLAVLTAVWIAYRVAVTLPSGNPLVVWAAVVVAYNVGAIALTFNYPLFNSQGGLEFWLLNACLVAAVRNSRAVGPARPPAKGPRFEPLRPAIHRTP